ncbi:hypothetical protein D1007_42805 [Hordeum vulgare]|nr:hypothetical protein D1007_42805 [Hordeum vulgare]
MAPTPPVAAPIPFAAAYTIKRKWQGSHLVLGVVEAGVAPTSVDLALVPCALAKGKKTGLVSPVGARGSPPRKKAITARGRAPPPPSVDPDIQIDDEATDHGRNLFDETTGRLLAEGTVNLSAPLADFDASYIKVDTEVNAKHEDDDEVQEIEEADYDARVGVSAGRGGNYTDKEDACLVKAWQIIFLDAIVGKDQTYDNYWQIIEGKFHPMMPYPSVRAIKVLQGCWRTINKACTRWSGCLEHVRNAPPSGLTIDDYDRIANEYYKQTSPKHRRFSLQHCWVWLLDSEKWRVRDKECLPKGGMKVGVADDDSSDDASRGGRNKDKPNGNKKEKAMVKRMPEAISLRDQIGDMVKMKETMLDKHWDAKISMAEKKEKHKEEKCLLRWWCDLFGPSSLTWWCEISGQVHEDGGAISPVQVHEDGGVSSPVQVHQDDGEASPIQVHEDGGVTSPVQAHEDGGAASPVQVHEDGGASSPVQVHEDGGSTSSVQVHEDGGVTSPIQVHEDGGATSPVQVHEDGGATSPVQVHEDGGATSPVQVHEDDGASSPVQVHEDGGLTSSVQVHEDDAVSSPIQVHEDGGATYPVQVHEDGGATSPVQVHEDGGATSPVQVHEDDGASSPVQVHEDGGVGSLVQVHEDDGATSPVQVHEDGGAISPVQVHEDGGASSPVQVHNMMVRPLLSMFMKMVVQPIRSKFMNMVVRPLRSKFMNMVVRPLRSKFMKMVLRPLRSKFTKMVVRPLRCKFMKMFVRPLRSKFM